MATLPPVSSSARGLQGGDTRSDTSSKPENVPVWRAPGFGAITSARSTVAGAAAHSGGGPVRRNYANDAEREQKLLEFGIKPLPQFTFEEIKQTQRDVLRVIAMVYDAPRGRTRADLELSLAEKLAAYHPGDPAYDLSKFQASEPKRLGNNYVQRQLVGARPFIMDGTFADMTGRGSGNRRTSTAAAAAAAAAAAQTGLLHFPAAVTGTDRQVDQASLRLAQLVPNLQTPAGIAAARATAVEPGNIRSGVLHLPEPEGDILLGLHPSSHAAYRWCSRCGTDVSTRFHNWYLHILKCDPIFYQNELSAFFSSRAGAGTPVLPPFGFPGGVKVSVPEEQHALVSRSKYMAALNGLGPDRVPVFVNAAKYFKTCVDPNETLERVEAIARWLRNTTLLKRVFESVQLVKRLPNAISDPGNRKILGFSSVSTETMAVTGPENPDKQLFYLESGRMLVSDNANQKEHRLGAGGTGAAVPGSKFSARVHLGSGAASQSAASALETSTRQDANAAASSGGPSDEDLRNEHPRGSIRDEQRFGRMMQHLGLARSIDEVIEVKKDFEREFGVTFDTRSPIIRKRPRIRGISEPQQQQQQQQQQQRPLRLLRL
ncbi:hypothetical protein CYME_CMT616C [Cyanidioschyzon merolae strain 10D]|uniref:Uncharacterized protein n=1 Tax=Cyanidioschyzon merolae (strain NIES-3377 / 10D) TaxID=280699 RepID=M1V7Y7_CYAM1|nr:hypothetical protein CYME_CMT616C [Cyanidioschyzon merolae strain 10D]BAM83515.1 hypothetical protein CYME_CMT616C [Cyanidioschyzon merolae strain 10D]|eukprot:XP_005539551.1 hypothetical protein CYME_CMT616C [Cyanidioschyzon merolae strain 10D]